MNDDDDDEKYMLSGVGWKEKEKTGFMSHKILIHINVTQSTEKHCIVYLCIKNSNSI
jgi:hypothetical protein